MPESSSSSSAPVHHPVFSEFVPFVGPVPPGFHISDFLGLRMREAFVAGLLAASGAQTRYFDHVTTGYPSFNDDYFLWIDLLVAVVAADRRLTVVELGTGHGEWLARAVLAARLRRPGLPVTLVGVEAEPTHFQWMRQHLTDNGIDPDHHELIEAAVDAQQGTVDFYVGNPDGWYGQAIAEPGNRIANASVRTVQAITLRDVLARVNEVDLLHLDVQGAELRVLESGLEPLNAQVRRLHVNTHGRDIERGLRELLWAAGWRKQADYSLGSVEWTPWGDFEFPDGVQSWSNPRYLADDPAAELQRSQSALRTADVRHSRVERELEALREQERKTAGRV